MTRQSRWIPWSFVAFFAIVVGVNAVMITLGVKSFSGLSTDDAYRRGLGFNREIARAEAADGLGWRFDATLADGVLRVTAAAADGAPLARLDLTALLERPAESGHDITLHLRESADGQYQAPVTLPLTGIWDLRLHASRDGQGAGHLQRLVVPP